jgi:tight adherence protein C
MAQIVIIIVLAVFAVFLIAFSLLGGGAEQKRSKLMERLGEGGGGLHDTREKKEGQSVAGEFLKRAAPVLAKPVMPKSDIERSNLRVRMANAGYRRESSPGIFLSSKVILGLAAFILAAMYALGKGYPNTKLIGMGTFFGGIAFMLPNLWLGLSIKARQEKITNGMPDALDLLVISVEAGLGLDQAMQRIGDDLETSHPELAEELRITAVEKQVGVPRAQALKNFAIRTGVPDVKALCAMLIQAERFGTSIARALRTHAQTLRVKRRQRAEERAAKTSVKLTFPLVLFIFPTIFVVSAGPAAIKIIETLSGIGG